MSISLIVAIDENQGIGRDNNLLFHISADLKRFKQLTTGNTIIMGRKTFDSLPNGPLPNRKHIVLSRTPNLEIDGCTVINSVDELRQYCEVGRENFVIGGGEIYKLLLPETSKMYITKVHAGAEADSFFPKIENEIWIKESESEIMVDKKTGLSFQYINYIRK